jgi:chemotaxis protein CheD
MSQLIVGISDCLVSRDPDATLVTYALGSCIAILIHDPVLSVGGLLHFMLPESALDLSKAQSKPFMFADTGIPALFHRAYDLGAAKQRLIVSAVGGAQVLDAENTFNVGKRNLLAVRKIMWKAGVRLHHEEVGGTAPRNVRIAVRTGSVIVSRAGEERELKQQGFERIQNSYAL